MSNFNIAIMDYKKVDEHRLKINLNERFLKLHQ